MSMNIEEEVTERVKRMMMTAASTASSLSLKAAITLLEKMKKQAQEEEGLLQFREGGLKTYDEMLKYVSEDNPLLTIVIPSAAKSDMIKELDAAKMPYFFNEIAGREGDILLHFLKNDEMHVQDAITAFLAKHHLVNEVSAQLFVEKVANKDMAIINDLSKDELELFRYYVQENKMDIQFAVHQGIDREDKFSIFVNNDQLNQARNLLKNVIWDLNGSWGSEIHRKIEDLLKSRQKVIEIMNKTDETYYIMSKNLDGSYIKISENGYEHYSRGRKINSISRDDKFFENSLLQALPSLHGYAILTKGEYDLDAMERNRIVRSRTEILPENMIPDMEHSAYGEMTNLMKQGVNDKSNEVLQQKLKKRQEKMALDDEHNNLWEIDDDSISYSEFSGYEFLDDQERAYRERTFNQAKATNAKLHDHEIISTENHGKTLDEVIDETVKKREQRKEKKRSREEQVR